MRKTGASVRKPLKKANAFGSSEAGAEKPAELAVVAAQGDTIVGEGERSADSPLVIPSKQNSDRLQAIRELTGQPADRREIRPASKVDESELSDVDEEAYERVPIEEFGAAMLRGMGWSGGDAGKAESEEDSRPRPSLLGLGAAPR
ncbi:DNA primase large subunit Spp2 [Coemansia sp. RSA 2610]|nr:DNA primase large subunit Spp2 [Coemansia sp. RSA 2610]